ncbi:MAG: tetratricopeptide repeat protein [Myxococcota bacterium]
MEPEELTEWEQRFVDACLKYAELYKGDKRVKNMIYKSAYLLYNKFQFDNAATQFRAVIAMNPASQQAEYAAQLILDALVVKEDWDSLRTTAKAFYDEKKLGGKVFKTDAYNIYENASFKLIDVTFEKDKDYSKAADAYMGFYEEFRETAKLEKTAKAVNNAAVYYSKSGRVADAVTAREILVEDEKYAGKTKYYYEQVGFLGYDYERIADYDKAAGYYEKLWGLYQERTGKKEKLSDDLVQQAGDAIFSAAVFRKGLGEWQQSITDYNAFVKAYPTDSRVADIKLRVGKIYEEQEQWEDAANAFQEFYAKPPKGSPMHFTYFARLHHGQALSKLGQTSARDKVYADTIKLYNKYVESGGEKGPQTEYVAEMLYTAALPSLATYEAMRIEGKRGVSKKREDAALKKSLEAKTKTYLEVEKSFQEVVNLGAGRWGIAALVALGKTYDNMAKSLRTSDVPSYLTDEQVEFYSMTIEDRAYLQEEKAVSAFKLAIDKSFELTLYNDDSAFATRRLGELRPEDYPGLHEQLVKPRWTSSKSGKKYDIEKSL